MAKKLGERLVEAGLVTKEAVEQALQQQKITGHKLGDCLVELGLVSESVLLRFLASELNTRFVSAEKLSKVKIPPEVMDKVPVRMAEGQKFIPIAMDSERKILSIVAAEPQNTALIDEIALVTGMDEVYAFIGLRSAIEAAIRKHYYGDPTAFTALDPGAPQGSLRSDVSAMAAAYDSRSGSGSMRMPIPLRFETDPRQRSSGTRVGNAATSMGAAPRENTSIVRASVGENDFSETLNIMVGLLEGQRPTLRGHSGQLARQANLVARRLALSPRETAHLSVAAYLHHLGKPHDKHFTLENNRINDGWAQDARRYLRAPVKLFETVRLPSAVLTILGQLYEAYDGSGASGMKGEEIAIGARILAAVDAYLDLMKNPANAHQRVFSRDEALKLLSENAGKLYDPVVVDVVGQIHSGELLRERLSSDGRLIVVADPDEGVRTDLLDSVRKLGLVAQALTTIEGVADLALAGEADLVAVGLRFGGQDLLALTDALRRQPGTASTPIVILGEPPEAIAKSQLLQAGVNAIVPMPLDPDAAARTLQQLYEDHIGHGAPGRPVRGSYDEMPQADLFRMLAEGKKSGRLGLRSDNGQEGFLQLERGRIVHAAFAGQAGDAALKAVMKLKTAEFAYEPEGLLLDMPTLDLELASLTAEAARAANA